MCMAAFILAFILILWVALVIIWIIGAKVLILVVVPCGELHVAALVILGIQTVFIVRIAKFCLAAVMKVGILVESMVIVQDGILTYILVAVEVPSP